MDPKFDPVSKILVDRPSDDCDLKSPVMAFFFPTGSSGETWLNLRERCYPAILDVFSDLVTEEQRMLAINFWFYERSMIEHMQTDLSDRDENEDTFGLYDIMVTLLALIYQRARAHKGLVHSDWLTTLLFEKLPGLLTYLAQKFPQGAHFYTGTLDYERITSNLSFLEKINWKILKNVEFYSVGQNGVHEMTVVNDPTDPFPSTVLGGVPIDDYLSDLERHSIDPSFGGLIPTVPRDTTLIYRLQKLCR